MADFEWKPVLSLYERNGELRYVDRNNVVYIIEPIAIQGPSPKGNHTDNDSQPVELKWWQFFMK